MDFACASFSPSAPFHTSSVLKKCPPILYCFLFFHFFTLALLIFLFAYEKVKEGERGVGKETKEARAKIFQVFNFFHLQSSP